MKEQSFAGIIPARYASTRFPGKPLADIGGKSMIRRVYEQAIQALDLVYVATDDKRIFMEVESFGGKACMTSPLHPSGTDRCAEAARIIGSETGSMPDVIVNIQGDEPFIQPGMIRELMSCFDRPGTQIATLARKISRPEDIPDPNKPKVVLNKAGNALYFSRSPLPYLRNHPQKNWHLHFHHLLHVGMYAYRKDVLQDIALLKPTGLEQAEALEQLRWLEHGFPVTVGLTNFENTGIDTPEDIENLKKAGRI